MNLSSSSPLAAALLCAALIPLPQNACAATDDPAPAWRAALAEREVILRYGDLERLLHLLETNAGDPTDRCPPAPKKPTLLTRAHYEVRADESGITAIEASFEAVHLEADWATLSLGDLPGAILTAETSGAVLGQQEGKTVLLIESIGTAKTQLTLAGPAQANVSFTPPAGVRGSLTLPTLQAPQTVTLRRDGITLTLATDQPISLPPGIGPIEISFAQPGPSDPTPAQVLRLPLIESAAYSTQIAQEGSELTEARWSLDATRPTVVPLTLPPGAELLRCSVDGVAIQPRSTGGDGWEISLSAASDASAQPPVLFFSYFLNGDALLDAEGERSLQLPRSPLIAQDLAWQVQWPEGYELEAKGPVTAMPAAEGSTGLHLHRRLCRDSATEVRITYRRPESR